MHYPPSQITPLCSFRFARFSSSHLFGRSLWGQSVAIYISRSLLKWVTGCQELIPVDQERRPACSWLDTLIACWRRASPVFLLTTTLPPPPSHFLKKNLHLSGHLPQTLGQCCFIPAVCLTKVPQKGGRFPRVFGDEFGEEFGDKFGDDFSESLNSVMNLVENLATNLVIHQNW